VPERQHANVTVGRPRRPPRRKQQLARTSRLREGTVQSEAGRNHDAYAPGSALIHPGQEISPDPGRMTSPPNMEAD